MGCAYVGVTDAVRCLLSILPCPLSMGALTWLTPGGGYGKTAYISQSPARQVSYPPPGQELVGELGDSAEN